MQYVEDQSGRIVLTERLRIRSPSNVEDRLNVEVDLATWEMVRDGAGAATEGTP